MDDELDLLGGSDGPAPPRRPPWVLVTGIVAVALLTLVGVAWAISSVAGNGGRVSAGAPASTAATTTPTGTPPATTPADASDTGFPTALPPTTAAPTASLPVVPVPPALTVAPTAVPTTPRLTPRRTTPPPATRPPTPPAGMRTVPNVVGQRIKSATSRLQAAGFRVSVLGGVFAPDRDSRRVTAQRPNAGSTARVGSIVVLFTDGI